MKLLPAALILGTGFLFKLFGSHKIASLILGIPALIVTVITLLTILVWVFLAVVMIAFGK